MKYLCIYSDKKSLEKIKNPNILSVVMEVEYSVQENGLCFHFLETIIMN